MSSKRPAKTIGPGVFDVNPGMLGRPAAPPHRPFVGGVGGTVDPAMQSAASSVLLTPEFRKLVEQHAAALGLAPPPSVPPPMSHPAVQSALSAVQGTPQFMALVSKHAAAIGGPRMQSKPPTTRQYLINFPKTTLRPGVRTVLRARPQMPFRGEKLIVAQGAEDALIHGLVVGSRQQFASLGDMPAAIFATGGAACPMDVCNVAQAIELEVSRPNGGDFSAVILGVALTDGGGPEAPFDVPQPQPDRLVEVAQAAIKEEEERYEPGVSLEELRDAGWDVGDG